MSRSPSEAWLVREYVTRPEARVIFTVGCSQVLMCAKSTEAAMPVATTSSTTSVGSRAEQVESL